MRINYVCLFLSISLFSNANPGLERLSVSFAAKFPGPRTEPGTQ